MGLIIAEKSGQQLRPIEFLIWVNQQVLVVKGGAI